MENSQVFDHLTLLAHGARSAAPIVALANKLPGSFRIMVGTAPGNDLSVTIETWVDMDMSAAARMELQLLAEKVKDLAADVVLFSTAVLGKTFLVETK